MGKIIRRGGIVQPNSVVCPFCQETMSKIEVKRNEPQEFVCSNCGFIVNFLSSGTGSHRGVMLKEIDVYA